MLTDVPSVLLDLLCLLVEMPKEDVLDVEAGWSASSCQCPTIIL